MVKRLGNITAAVALGLLLSGSNVNAEEIKTMTTTANLNIRSGAGTQYTVLGSYDKNTSVQVISIENGWAKVSFNGKTAYCNASYLKDTSTSKTMKTKADLNVRTGPGTKYEILGSLKKGTTISVKSTNDGWAKISFNGKTGYCSSEYLQEVSSTSSGANSSSSASSTKTTMITTADLNVRSGAGTKYGVIGSYSKGTKVSVLSISNGWAKVSYNGKTGYCSAEYLKKVSSSSSSSNSGANSSSSTSSTKTTMITTADLNVRSGAGTKYGIIGSYSKGTKVSVSSISNGWAKVSYNGKTGYCSTKYLQKLSSNSSSSNSSSSSSSSPSTSTSNNKIAMITTADLNVRSGAGTKYSVIGSYSKGTKIDVLSVTSGWAKVSYNGKTGYCSTEYLKEVDDDKSTADTYEIMVTTTNVNVRKGPGTFYDKLGTLNAKEEVKVISISDGWAKIYYNKQTGYVSATYLKETSSSSEEEISYKIMKSTTYLNVRMGAASTAEKLGLLAPDEEVKVISISDGWAKILYKNEIAYCSSSYLADEQASTEEDSGKVESDKPVLEEVSDSVTVNASQLNVRKGPGEEYEIIGTVSQGQTLNRSGIHKNGWSRIEYNGQVGYVKNSYLVVSKYDSNNKIYYYNKELTFTLDNFINGQLTKYNFSSKGETINSNTLNKYINTDLLINNGNIYQFLKLNKFRDNINVDKLNSYLNSLQYDTFYNQGQAFINAAREYNIDPLYLVAHTILETGYGKSTLARGVDYEVPASAGEETKVVRVYNLFGIGAYDDDPLGGGAATAYKNGWTSIELAIKGGAQWIANNYVHSTRSGQHQYTLYMMRWNTNSYVSESNNAIWHQYATDICWADSISYLMKQLSYLYENAVLELEIPVFLQE